MKVRIHYREKVAEQETASAAVHVDVEIPEIAEDSIIMYVEHIKRQS